MGLFHAMIVQLCWLSIALITIVLSIITAKELIDLESRMNKLHDGTIPNLRTCLVDKPATNDCDDESFCTKYTNPANPDVSFMASKYFSCLDPIVCKKFFNGINGSNPELKAQWQNTMKFRGVNIPYVFIGSLMTRAVSSAIGAFSQSLEFCKIRMSRVASRSLNQLRYLTGIASAIFFFAIAGLLYAIDTTKVINDIIDAECYGFRGESIKARQSNKQTIIVI